MIIALRAIVDDDVMCEKESGRSSLIFVCSIGPSIVIWILVMGKCGTIWQASHSLIRRMAVIMSSVCVFGKTHCKPYCT